jgi:Tol biopolymer transport system component
VRGNGEVENLRTSDGLVYASDVSPDGKRVAYVLNHPETGFDIWQLEMTGPHEATPVLRSPYGEYHPQFSPVGGWLAYTSTESGREDVYVQAFPDAGRPQLVSIGGGSFPRWSRDGRTLFYRAADGRLVRRRIQLTNPSLESLELSPPTVVTRLPDVPANLTYPYDVAADGRILALMLPGTTRGVAMNVLMNWQSALKRVAADAPSR